MEEKLHGGHSEKLIFCAYAEDEKKKTGANLTQGSDRRDTYLKNAMVCLCSAKIANPECDVALITTVELPERYKAMMQKYGILYGYCPFDSFCFPDTYKWGLAFYKLCAYEYVLQLEYEQYLMLDTDTYTQSSLSDLWVDAKYHVMLYDINQRLGLKGAAKFQDQVQEFIGGGYCPITQYGGEFIAGSKENLLQLIACCKEVYSEMRIREFSTDFGDEFILCIAAERNKMMIKAAGGYVFRFWTGEFRLVSTCYKFDPISVIHVPSQKSTGMIKIFTLLEQCKAVTPPMAHRLLRLDKARWQTRIKHKLGILREYQ